MGKDIYFDNAATTKISDKALEAYINAAETYYGNPSSVHSAGMNAGKALEDARMVIGEYLHTDRRNILFTAGGSQGNNFGLLRTVGRRRPKKAITTSIEHPSVANCFTFMEQNGYEVNRIGVDYRDGFDIKMFEESLNAETSLVSVMHVNNETGAILPVEDIGRIIKKKAPEAIFHVDGVQAFGKHTINPAKCGIDIYTSSAHKLHGPHGIGAVYISDRLKPETYLYGGGQERNLISGTQSVASARGFAAALEETLNECGTARVTAVHDRLKQGICKSGYKYNILSPENGSPYILNVSFTALRSEIILNALSERNIYVSAGSACSSYAKHNLVLESMNIASKIADSAIRFSFSPENTEEEADCTVSALNDIMEKIIIRKR